jgi:hypothetical protein
LTPFAAVTMVNGKRSIRYATVETAKQYILKAALVNPHGTVVMEQPLDVAAAK